MFGLTKDSGLPVIGQADAPAVAAVAQGASVTAAPGAADVSVSQAGETLIIIIELAGEPLLIGLHGLQVGAHEYALQVSVRGGANGSENHGEIVVRHRVSGLHRDGLLQMVNGFVRLIQLGQCPAHQVVRLELIGLESQGLIKMRDSRGKITLHHRDLAQAKMRCEKLGP